MVGLRGKGDAAMGKWWKRLVLLSVIPAVLLLTAAAAGCGERKAGGEEEVKAQEGSAEAKGSQISGEEGTIVITLYFLKSTPTDFFLAPEKRVIPYTQAVARAAAEELFKGPAPGSELAPIFPNTVKVLDVSIEDGTCFLNVSREIITDKAKQGGAGAQTEGLALASIANTLTEFPTIRKVKLLVEGKQSGQVDGLYIEDFWGHVGLPEYLERDLSVVEPSS